MPLTLFQSLSDLSNEQGYLTNHGRDYDDRYYGDFDSFSAESFYDDDDDDDDDVY